jgi:hypothetical protein
MPVRQSSFGRVDEQIIRRLRMISVVCLTLLCLGPATVQALDLSGFVRLLWTDGEFNEVSAQTLDQQFSVNLRQDLTPYLRILAGYRYNGLDSSRDDAVEFSRRLNQPEVQLAYSRPRLSANLRYRLRDATSSVEASDLESRSLIGSALWQALPRLSFNFVAREEVNLTGVSAVGRNTQNRSASGTMRYVRPFWTGSIVLARNELDNETSGVRVTQNRQDLRLDGGRDFFNQRLSLGFSGSIGWAQRDQEISEGADLAEPLPLLEGLFAIDLTPTIGELVPAPGLIDGDLLTPVSPPIEIGAANTFRNIGLDLGITRPLSRLEIWVDRPSGPNVQWVVYQSRDNMFWEPIPGATSLWDDSLLRYTLRFPDIENRFFKVVNASANPAVQVLVTEIRALRDLSEAGVDDSLGQQLYRVNVAARYRVSSRVSADLSFNSQNDRSLVAGIVRNSYQTQSGRAGLAIELTRTLRLSLSYQRFESSDQRDPPLDRTTETANANLLWAPLPTVDIALTVGTIDESELGDPLQSSLTSRLAVGLTLLKDLYLSSDLSYTELQDPFSGFDRNTVAWTQRLRMQPLPSWALTGGYSYRRTENPERQTIIDQVNSFVETTWAVGSYLVLTGTWLYNTDDFSDSFRQNYGISYHPGPKLSLSAAWNAYEASSGLSTGNANAGLTYRLYSRVSFSASLNQSRTTFGEGREEQSTNLVLGLLIGF